MVLKMRKNVSALPPECCPLLECISLIGGAWTPNIIWHLRGGARRFSELRADIPEISPKILTARLRELEEGGVVDRNVISTSPPSVEYSLNAFGMRLVPAIEAIATVGEDIQKRKSKPPRSAPKRKHLHAPRHKESVSNKV